jgi:hypothetical protein
MRGLHWVYETDPPLEAEAVAAALESAFEGKLVRGEERWGERVVIRLILQFVVEFRVGEREGQVSLIHRVTSSPADRVRSEATLGRVLGGERADD